MSTASQCGFLEASNSTRGDEKWLPFSWHPQPSLAAGDHYQSTERKQKAHQTANIKSVFQLPGVKRVPICNSCAQIC